jgi:alpha-D-xyloside xylohydrolase
MRWFEATALSPVMQVGTNANDLPWSFGEAKESDPEILDAYRNYARLHMRLFPYVWTYAQRLADDGRAIQRPLGLAFPELGVHPWDTFLLGDHLLVAPVVQAGATSRDVILPHGQWVDWWTGTIHEGNQTVTRDAPLDVLPLFARAGAPIPMLRDPIDTTATASDSAVDSFGSDPGILTLAIAPGPQESFTLYDQTLVTQLTLGTAAETRTVELSVLPGETFTHGVAIELYGVGVAEVLPTVTDGATETPRAQTREAIEAGTIGWAWSEARGGTVWIHAPGGAQSFAVTLPAVEAVIAL